MKTRNYHQILGKMLFEPWFILESKHASMMQQLRVRIDPSARLHDDNPDLIDDDDPPAAPEAKPTVDQYGIALISISGIIGKRLSWLEMMCGGYDIDTLNAELTEADEDDDVHTIIMWWDTPGGMYTGAPETAALIADIRSRKTVISFSDTQCCSLGQWLASQAGECYGTHSSMWGSVGGFIAGIDTSAEWEKIGWALELFKSGENKAMGLDGKKWEESEREFLRARVAKQTGEFYAAVRAGRPGVADEVIKTANVYDGDEAIKVGLLDRNVKNIQEVINAALAAHYSDLPPEQQWGQHGDPPSGR